jgi:hypothetical protein
MAVKILSPYPASVVVEGIGTDPPASGDISKIDRTGLVANIASTKITDGRPPGIYWLQGELEITTSGATTLNLNVTHTDDVGPITEVYASLSSGVGRASVNSTAYLASGDYTFTVTGWAGAMVYALRLRCFYGG